MIDSIIAGLNLGAKGIAAVALGVPGYGVLAAVIYSLIHGSGLRMIWAKGHSDDRGALRAFNGGQLHIKLRAEGEKTELFIRSLGRRFNMPEYTMAHGDNESVSYSYVYKMNIVCITLTWRCLVRTD